MLPRRQRQYATPRGANANNRRPAVALVIYAKHILQTMRGAGDTLEIKRDLTSLLELLERLGVVIDLPWHDTGRGVNAAVANEWYRLWTRGGRDTL